MAELFIRHSLNSYKTVKFNLSLNEYVPKDGTGETRWMVTIGTMCPDTQGKVIPPTNVYKITEHDLEGEIAKAVGKMCSFIDWTSLEIDREAPYVIEFIPEGQNVLPTTNISISMRDNLPSSGIDMSEMVVTLNNGEVDYDITSELVVTGSPYETTLTWVSQNT